jgi:hypothetical protein
MASLPPGWHTVRRDLSDEQWAALLAKHQAAERLLSEVERTVRATLGFEMARELELVRVQLDAFRERLANVADGVQAVREIQEEIAENDASY